MLEVKFKIEKIVSYRHSATRSLEPEGEMEYRKNGTNLFRKRERLEKIVKIS